MSQSFIRSCENTASPGLYGDQRCSGCVTGPGPAVQEFYPWKLGQKLKAT